MPIKVPDNLPAKEILQNEHIFVMDESRAYHQDIRPLKIVILNLMPKKQETEVQLLRLIGNTPLQIEITLMRTESHVSKNVSAEYLTAYYDTFNNVRGEHFDGMIITGAPVEDMPFEQVNYWDELSRVFEWTKDNVTSTLHICWGAQAALYYRYGVEKRPLPRKMFGVFTHNITRHVSLTRGFDDTFCAPHSRHTGVDLADIAKIDNFDIIATSDIAGFYIGATKDGREVYVTGHSEYDPLTLKAEFERDVRKGLRIEMPENYFYGGDPAKPPMVTWRAHSNLLFSNWLNYYVYQETPYDITQIHR